MARNRDRGEVGGHVSSLYRAIQASTTRWTIPDSARAAAIRKFHASWFRSWTEF